MGGRIVQLVHGEKLQLAFDDFDYWLGRFSGYPLVQLIDLDAAMRQGDNHELIGRISRQLPCQVGGGIATVAKAEAVLQAGAKRVIIGSALFRTDAGAGSSGADLIDTAFAASLLGKLGAKHIVASIDTKQGKIAIKGWKEQMQLTPDESITVLDAYCGAFLYTHIDKEGTMEGFPLEVAKRLRALTDKQLIVAGGIREMAEIEALDQLHVDAVAGMAVYTGTLQT
jgi:phosphoribosylformimino-5-aminoimidazole carboxamide ribotide isomerase